jgi:hypothetical protein
VEQTIINTGIAIIGALIGFVITGMCKSIKELERNDVTLERKVSKVELDMATAYLRRAEFDNFSTLIFAKLDRIESKIDEKADKKLTIQ